MNTMDEPREVIAPGAFKNLPKTVPLRLGIGGPIIGTATAHAVHGAIEIETTRLTGTMLGLTSEDVSEVITAWTTAYNQTPLDIDHPAIRNAVTLRANDLPWRPEIRSTPLGLTIDPEQQPRRTGDDTPT